MKTVISDTTRFQPIDVTITLESLEDIKILWHRTNINMHKVIDEYKTVPTVEFPNPNCDEGDLWYQLNKLADKLGLKDHLKF